ncbi:CHAD domain-containing protein [Vibrio quintilis]|uniref:CHAD domain protein n=1 Tax=Vibrio quintilis TaxID=1117707 RepID=A0A1M7Z0C1_9VIBR|nr:CHAD domain-containing protein [Vibrio quintilis]SHO58262.1 CHAD domain protein [Vibrio quintilis]
MAIKQFRKHTFQIIEAMHHCHEALIGCRSEKETVHDLRVSIRRLMPVMNVLIRLEDDKQEIIDLKTHQKRCKGVFKALSAPRDLEVQIQLAASLRTLQDWPELLIQPYIDDLCEEKHQLDEGIIPVVKAMNLTESTDFVCRKMRLLSCEKPRFREILDMLHSRLEAKLRQSFVRLKELPEHFHETRIMLKKYRYHVELEVAVQGNPPEKARILKQIQDHLGDTNDLSVALQLMKAHQVDSAVVADVEQLCHSHLERSVSYLFSCEAILWD